MRELHLLTLPFDPATGGFDEQALRLHLLGRELIRAEPSFFVHEGQPFWTVAVESRPLPEPEAPPQRQDRADEPPPRRSRELDPAGRQRYGRLVAWRRQAAEREGVPPYVIFTNAQGTELAERAPRTLEALGQVQGIGRKRVQRHGAAILEVLHGPAAGRAEGAAAVRAVDGHDPLAAGACPGRSRRTNSMPGSTGCRPARTP